MRLISGKMVGNSKYEEEALPCLIIKHGGQFSK